MIRRIMFFFSSFYNFIKSQIYKRLSNPQHGGESCDRGPTTLKVLTLSVHTVCAYTMVLSLFFCNRLLEFNLLLFAPCREIDKILIRSKRDDPKEDIYIKEE